MKDKKRYCPRHGEWKQVDHVNVCPKCNDEYALNEDFYREVTAQRYADQMESRLRRERW